MDQIMEELKLQAFRWELGEGGILDGGGGRVHG